jgi:hypothetical protein
MSEKNAVVGIIQRPSRGNDVFGTAVVLVFIVSFYKAQTNRPM